MARRSAKPSVVTRPVTAPRRSSTALVATVVPWATSEGEAAPALSSACRRPRSKPSLWSSGVVGTLQTAREPPRTMTTSVNVPPTSMPTLGRSPGRAGGSGALLLASHPQLKGAHRPEGGVNRPVHLGEQCSRDDGQRRRHRFGGHELQGYLERVLVASQGGGEDGDGRARELAPLRIRHVVAAGIRHGASFGFTVRARAPIVALFRLRRHPYFGGLAASGAPESCPEG